MCNCERHLDPDAECTCICVEHGNFERARELAMSRYDEILRLQAETRAHEPTPSPEQNIGEVARGLQQIHDDMVASIGDVYVNLTASWTGPDGKLTTLSYGTVAPDDEDDEP